MIAAEPTDPQDGRPDLSKAQVKLLRFLVSAFREHSSWPTLQSAEEILPQEGVDPAAALSRMPVGLVNADIQQLARVIRPDQEVRVSVAGLIRSAAAPHEVRYFLRALDYLASRAGQRDYVNGKSPIVTSEDIRAAIGGADSDLEKLLLLIRVEGYIAYAVTGVGANWSLRPSGLVRQFAGLRSPREYLAIRAQLLKMDPRTLPAVPSKKRWCANEVCAPIKAQDPEASCSDAIRACIASKCAADCGGVSFGGGGIFVIA